jgi:A/G-specific adenine glycosylase
MVQFLQLIYKWYGLNKRDLPWRLTNDPYKIWVSEIILQQTQVKQGKGYYLRFISRFPTLSSLAESSENEVLKVWQGLGYYSRARNLHFSSRIIVEKYNGKFPVNYNDIINLKGIGEYTAAAIVSIAYNRPYAAVDGNINRFLARYFEIDDPVNSSKGKNKIRAIAEEILDRENPGKHNQALMELGAMVCIPVNPVCKFCPVNDTCLAFNNHSVVRLPVKKESLKQKNRFFFYFLIEGNNFIFLQQRKGKDIWENLYELPLIETKENRSVREVLESKEFKNILNDSEFLILNIDEPVIHVLSHQKINTLFVHIRLLSENKFTLPVLWVNKKDIPKFAIPRLIENYLVKSGLL